MKKPFLRSSAICSLPLLALMACTASIPVYESPASGPMSNITFINRAKTQRASFDTFDDGAACTGRRQIQFANDTTIPVGGSRSLTVTAGHEFALFASLARIETDELSVDIGMTGGGPVPMKTRTVLALGCSIELSFEPRPGKNYEIAIFESTSPGSCSVDVTEIDGNGTRIPVATSIRTPLLSRGPMGPFCELLR